MTCAALQEEPGTRPTVARGGTPCPGAALARSLGISPGDPVLVLRSIVYGNQGPVEMFVAYHRGDRSRFEVSLTRTSAATLKREPLMHVTV